MFRQLVDLKTGKQQHNLSLCDQIWLLENSDQKRRLGGTWNEDFVSQNRYALVSGTDLILCPYPCNTLQYCGKRKFFVSRRLCLGSIREYSVLAGGIAVCYTVMTLFAWATFPFPMTLLFCLKQKSIFWNLLSNQNTASIRLWNWNGTDWSFPAFHRSHTYRE